MGQGQSKTSPSNTEHVFTSETPVRFSQDLVNALQASPETDSTRSKDLELHVQKRVTAELARLSESHSAKLAELQDQLSPSDTSEDPSTQSDHSDQKDSKEEKETRTTDLGRESVQEELNKLKAKLHLRRIREDVMDDKKVEKAKEEMVSCLRLNDRRPLDCWKEVDAFKKEVGRLEKNFLVKAIE